MADYFNAQLGGHHVGSILLHRVTDVPGRDIVWLLDGQQRLTNLLGVQGIRATWQSDAEWATTQKRCEMVFRPRTRTFHPLGSSQVGSAVRRELKSGSKLAYGSGDTRAILALELFGPRLREVVAEFATEGVSVDETYAYLVQVREAIRSANLILIEGEGSREEGVAQFLGLNSGQKVLSSEDAILGMLSGFVPKYRYETFDRIREELAAKGFPFTEKFLLNMVATSHDISHTRVDTLRRDPAYLDETVLLGATAKAKRRACRLVDYLKACGIPDLSVVHSTAQNTSLLIMAHFLDRFPEASGDRALVGWWLKTVQYRFYNGQVDGAMRSGLQAVYDAATATEALAALNANVDLTLSPGIVPICLEHLSGEAKYEDRRLLTLARRILDATNKVLDPISGVEVLRTADPESDHVYSKKSASRAGLPEALWNAEGNRMWVTQATNKRKASLAPGSFYEANEFAGWETHGRDGSFPALTQATLAESNRRTAAHILSGFEALGLHTKVPAAGLPSDTSAVTTLLLLHALMSQSALLVDPVVV